MRHSTPQGSLRRWASQENNGLADRLTSSSGEVTGHLMMHKEGQETDPPDTKTETVRSFRGILGMEKDTTVDHWCKF